MSTANVSNCFYIYLIFSHLSITFAVHLSQLFFCRFLLVYPLAISLQAHHTIPQAGPTMHAWPGLFHIERIPEGILAQQA